LDAAKAGSTCCADLLGAGAVIALFGALAINFGFDAIVFCVLIDLGIAFCVAGVLP